MSAPQFVHLRVHTAYSLSEGAMLVPKLIHKLHDQGVPAIAVTDTANMFGGKAFSKYASDEGVKPILGCQFYLRNPDADDVLKAKGRIIEPDKIVLLVMNENGYQNIMKLMKRSYLDNPKQGEKAQLKMSDLEELNGGLIALTAGVEGQIGRLLLENRKAEAEEVVVKLREILQTAFIWKFRVSAWKRNKKRKTTLSILHINTIFRWLPPTRLFSLTPICMKRMMP